VKLIAILAWYDESPSWLAATVSSLVHHCEIDHLVAVDGAYALLPGGRPFSGFEQHQVIDEICRGSQVGLTLHAPREVWFGNEVEKRSFAFQLAEQVTGDDRDWYFVIDADEVVTSALGLRQRLEATDHDVGVLSLFERFDPHATPGASKVAHRAYLPREAACPSQRFFRALRRLHVAENHYTYLDGNGRMLWRADPQLEPAIDTRVEMEHRTQLRDIARREQQQAYYRRRDELGVERVFTVEVQEDDGKTPLRIGLALAGEAE
jgi:hypothetical protein